MAWIPKIPKIPDEERTPPVTVLLEIIQIQNEHIQELRDEIARLKGQKPRPRIKASKPERNSDNKGQKDTTAKRPGSSKRKKTPDLAIHDTVIIPAENVPTGSIRKGFEEFTVQGIRFRLHNTLYRRERWLAPDGNTIIAPLPHDVTEVGGHFDAALVSYVLVQY